MEAQTVFGDVPVAKFIDEYLHRLPFALAGSARGVCQLGTWGALDAMLARAGGDAFAVRAGQWYEGTMPRDAAGGRALSAEGYTLFVRHAERHHPELAELAEAFERAFLGPVNVHVFATPAGSPGFSWHYDAEDVFIIQTAGEKEYSLRKNTVNPWPVEETLPADMQYERELMPLMRVLMRAGDLLYIPCGYWHKAEAKPSRTEFSPPVNDDGLKSVLHDAGKTAISLAVGVMSRSAMEVWDFLRPHLMESLVWRQRLPLMGAASAASREELEATYRQLFEQLARDLAKTFADPRLVTEFLSQLPSGAADEPTGGGEGK